MARVSARNITVEYPIFSAWNMSLRNALLEIGTGGVITRNARSIVTIKAISDVSFELGDGDRVGLVGHNGAGKSTLLRAIAGIYKPTQGAIDTEGRISTILQLSAGLHPELTGYENIVRMAMLMGATKRDAQQLIPDVEVFTDLGNFLSMPVSTYSAGMMTRLSFAVATAVQPEIMLIDEILSAGDADFQKRAKQRLDSVIESSRILVLASHSDSIIDFYCNRILRFEHGRLVEDTKKAA